MDTLIELGIAVANVNKAYKTFFRQMGRADINGAMDTAQQLHDDATDLATLAQTIHDNGITGDNT